VQTRHPASKLFALRVSGDSMVGAGILDGDVVIVRRQRTANSGEIVVALVGDEATVKRLKFHAKRVELHPENPAYDPIIPDPKELLLLGKVIEVRRRLGNG
jgi:repressor LexA